MDEVERAKAVDAEKEFYDLPIDDKTRQVIVDWGTKHYPKCGFGSITEIALHGGNHGR